MVFPMVRTRGVNRIPLLILPSLTADRDRYNGHFALKVVSADDHDPDIAREMRIFELLYGLSSVVRPHRAAAQFDTGRTADERLLMSSSEICVCLAIWIVLSR